MNKLTKTTIWKDLIALLVVLTIISCIFIFNIKIGFSVFENIDTNKLFLFVLSTIIVILIIIFIIFIILYKRKKKRGNNNEKNL